MDAHPLSPLDSVEWTTLPGLSPYAETAAAMEARATAIREDGAPEAVWLLEHPALYTAGTSAAPGDLIHPDRFPVHPTGRGGRYTYHGPGQRVGYVLLDLNRRGRDVRRFVHGVEGWLLAALGQLGVQAFTDPDRIGLWVEGPSGPAKIGAIGVRVRRWVTLHGFALNIAPDLGHFTGIVPCGINDFPVTSLSQLGSDAGFAALDQALFREFPRFLANLCRDAAGA